jgi:23S rRNA pseudouridine1911/1915/1917 synthase
MEAEILHTLSVQPSQGGIRLDRWLADQLPGVSRARVQDLIAGGWVEGPSGPAGDPSRKTRPGESYQVRIPPPAPATPEPEAIALRVVYEDEALIVIDKPAGMVVHPAPGSPNATLVNALLYHCTDSLSGIGGVKRPGIVHRLDKDTSGLLVAAKSDAAHQGLAAQFAEHSIKRTYRAVCWGVPVPARGEVRGNIGRNPGDRKKMAVVRSGGKEALTRYRVQKAFGAAGALVECELATGRTHQIRVHMASIGHPLIGDPAYGRDRSNRMKGLAAEIRTGIAAFARQALHAYRLGFLHPTTGEFLQFESSNPNDFNELISCLESI